MWHTNPSHQHFGTSESGFFANTGSVPFSIEKENLEFISFDDAVYQLANDLADMVISKQKDYGTENILGAPGGADNGILIRLWDKISRLKNLITSGKDAQNESVEDTYKDIAGYALVALMVSKGYFELPLLEEE
jgi:hypothetical protein